MIIYWAQDVLLAIWTVAFVCSSVFYEGFSRQTPRPERKVVPAPPPTREQTPALPSMLARALEQVEDQTFPVARDHLSNA